MDIINTIIITISEVLNTEKPVIESLGYDMELQEQGLNSITSMDILLKLEKQFNIQFEGDELLINNNNTINKLLKLINLKIKHTGKD